MLRRAVCCLVVAAIIWIVAVIPAGHSISILARSRDQVAVADAAQPQATPTGYQGTFTYHNDNARTGQNLFEPTLSPANVNPNSFGRLFAYGVDGYVYAEPLYVPNVTIPGQGVHNVVYVATEHDSVYALDADAPGAPLWQVSFTNPANGVTTVPFTDANNCAVIVPEIGITSTPVIDPATGTLYVVAKTKENGGWAQRLHALDLATGAEKFGGPVLIQASAPGSAAPNDGDGNVLWDPLVANQRAALLLNDGVIYIAFASYCDLGAYHGWILAYNAATLAQIAAYNSTPNGTLGGIWETGNGPAADSAGNIFAAVGNGTFDVGNDNGDSALRLQLVSNAPSPGFTLSALDSFTPFNQQTLDDFDLDFGTAGPMLLPDQSTGPAHLMIVGDKTGAIYVLNRDNLGGFQANDNSQIVQNLTGVVGPLFGSAAYWQGNVYFSAPSDAVKAFGLSGGQLSNSPTSQSARVIGFPGASPVISANGSMNGILWVLDNGGQLSDAPAVLCAFDANDLSKQLYCQRPVGSTRPCGNRGEVHGAHGCEQQSLCSRSPAVDGVRTASGSRSYPDRGPGGL